MTESADANPKFKVRIESLSDLVFGLALSLGAIALIQGQVPRDPSTLTRDVELFAFSFLIIVRIWLGYTRIVSVLPVETPGALSLNLCLLFCVALEPFLYYVFQTAAIGFLDFSSAAFALDTGSMMALLSGMTYAVVREEKRGNVRRLSPIVLRNFEIGAFAQAIAAGVFLVSTSQVFWIPIPYLGFLRFLVWFVALAAVFTSRTVRRFSAKERVEVAKP